MRLLLWRHKKWSLGLATKLVAREMVGAGEGPSDGGNSSSASASDVLSSSSLPRSFSYGTDDGLETGRQSLLDSRANSTNSLLVSQRGSGMQLLSALLFNIFWGLSNFKDLKK
jgi:hypothetical protein